jgi:hypothetical protein
VENHGGLILSGKKPEGLGDKPAAVPRRLPQIPRVFTLAQSRAPVVRGIPFSSFHFLCFFTPSVLLFFLFYAFLEVCTHTLFTLKRT